MLSYAQNRGRPGRRRPVSGPVFSRCACVGSVRRGFMPGMERMMKPADELMQEIEALRDRLARLSRASLLINESSDTNRARWRMRRR